MPLDVVRLTDSDLFALSTGEEFKAAVTLWCKAWLQIPAASLPDDDRILAHLSGTGSRWKKLRDMALRGFVKASDGRLYHAVIAEKALEAWKHRLQQRERAAKRWDKEKRSSGNATAYATASPTAMQGTGTGTDTVDKSTAAKAVDPVKYMFDTGIAYLATCGLPENKARPMLGKWNRDYGAVRVLEAIGAAQRQGIIDPVSWIEARWRAANDQGGRSYVEAPC
jgi:3D (Asp-Asp-Asp) domain-containing protein